MTRTEIEATGATILAVTRRLASAEEIAAADLACGSPRPRHTTSERTYWLDRALANAHPLEIAPAMPSDYYGSAPRSVGNRDGRGQFVTGV